MKIKSSKSLSKENLAAIKKGLEQSNKDNVKNLGSFKQYIN